LTIDQSNSELGVSIDYNLGFANSAGSCDDAAQRERVWDVRGRLRNMPARKIRMAPRSSGDAHYGPSLTSAARVDVEQLEAIAHEDLCRVNEILRSQQCTAVIRGVDSEKPRTITGALTHSVSILDAEGHALASLDLIRGDEARLESSERLLRALADSAARAITERWFRLVHRRHWVVAAMRRNAPGTTIMFAADRDQRLLGADRQARQWLEEKGRRLSHHPTISTLFRPNPTLLRRRSNCDVSTTLFASGDGEPWIALLTPPDTGAIESNRDARVLLHIRPRLDSLAHPSSMPPGGRAKRGLSQAALQRIEEYIERHLDSALDINQLAAIVRMSCSHFTRSFHKSVGITPHRYVIQNRVMRARELLATTTLPLTEIALTTGFSDQSHFSRRFHEIVGIPPGAFRGHDARLAP
jgi:AraC-like DNA-binding protein